MASERLDTAVATTVPTVIGDNRQLHSKPPPAVNECYSDFTTTISHHENARFSLPQETIRRYGVISQTTPFSNGPPTRLVPYMLPAVSKANLPLGRYPSLQVGKPSAQKSCNEE